jgi:hypothetical protein
MYIYIFVPYVASLYCVLRQFLHNVNNSIATAINQLNFRFSCDTECTILGRYVTFWCWLRPWNTQYEEYELAFKTTPTVWNFTPQLRKPINRPCAWRVPLTKSTAIKVEILPWNGLAMVWAQGRVSTMSYSFAWQALPSVPSAASPSACSRLDYRAAYPTFSSYGALREAKAGRRRKIKSLPFHGRWFRLQAQSYSLIFLLCWLRNILRWLRSDPCRFLVQSVRCFYLRLTDTGMCQ